MELYLHHINSTILLSTIALVLTIISYLCKNLVFCGKFINTFLSWFKYSLPDSDCSSKKKNINISPSGLHSQNFFIEGKDFITREIPPQQDSSSQSRLKTPIKSFVVDKEEKLSEVVIQASSSISPASCAKLDIERIERLDTAKIL